MLELQGPYSAPVEGLGACRPPTKWKYFTMEKCDELFALSKKQRTCHPTSRYSGFKSSSNILDCFYTKFVCTLYNRSILNKCSCYNGFKKIFFIASHIYVIYFFVILLLLLLCNFHKYLQLFKGFSYGYSLV